MITLELYHYTFNDELKDLCIEFSENLVGIPDDVEIIMDDEEDPESSYTISLKYSTLNIGNFEYYDEFMDFANENEISVIVNDTEAKTRKGFWFDEYDVWIDQSLDADGLWINQNID